MRFTHILSVNLFADGDFEPLRQFYEGACDLPFLRDKGGMLSFYTGDTALTIVKADAETAQYVGRSTGLALRTRAGGNLARLIERIRAKNYVVADADFGSFRGGHRLHIADPAGNRVTLWEPPEGAPEWDAPSMYEAPGQVTIAVSDVRRALGFYTTVLELPMVDQPDPYTAIFFFEGTQLIVAQRPTWSPAEPVVGETGLVLACEDPHSMLDNLQGRGVRLAEPPRELGATVVASFCDPDNNRLTMLGR